MKKRMINDKYVEIGNDLIIKGYNDLKCYSCNNCEIKDKSHKGDFYFSLKCAYNKDMFNKNCKDYTRSPNGDIREILIEKYGIIEDVIIDDVYDEHSNCM